MTPPLWFAPPAACVPLDLRADARHRVDRLVRLTPTLPGAERLHLAAAAETQVESLRRAGVGWAATCAVRVDGSPPRLSTALITLAVREVDCGGGFVLDAVARHLAAVGGARRAGPVDLPLGRALAVVAETSVRTHVSAVGRPRERVHRVHHAHLVVAHPDRRHLVTLSIGTECGSDAERYRDLLDAVGRSLSVDPPSAGGAVATALDPPGDHR